MYYTQEQIDRANQADLVKNIGGTTFDIHIHFSETSRETFTDKVVRLIQNDSGDETA